MSNLLNRAMAAFLRSSDASQPSGASSGEEEIEGKKYIVLRNVRGVLAVYRVRIVKGVEVLKRLRRYPSQIQ